MVDFKKESRKRTIDKPRAIRVPGVSAKEKTPKSGLPLEDHFKSKEHPMPISRKKGIIERRRSRSKLMKELEKNDQSQFKHKKRGRILL